MTTPAPPQPRDDESVNWFRRCPNGGTIFQVDLSRLSPLRPTGGGTVHTASKETQ